MNSIEGEGGWARQILARVSNLVCICREGRITYINPHGAEMLGFPALDLLGREFADFVDPDYGELMALGLETFAEEEGGVPLKLVLDGERSIDVHMTVAALDTEGDEVPSFMVECRDITEYIRAAREAGEREKRLRRILDTVADGIITVGTDGRIETFNPAAERIFGFQAREVLGQPVTILVPESVHGNEEIASYIENKGTQILGKARELEGRRKDGTTFPMELTAAELKEERGRVLAGVVRDITERKKAEEEIKRLALHDALTGLPNRNMFNDRLERAIGRAKRLHRQVGLMFIDLDKFKPVNDNLGHDAGDFVLKGVAERLRAHLRTTDTIARVGGDEFVVILENLDDWHAAGGVAQKLIESLAEPFDWRGTPCDLGASIGIAVYPRDAETPADLIRCADDAMYRVKQSGRNNFVYYDPSETA